MNLKRLPINFCPIILIIGLFIFSSFYSPALDSASLPNIDISKSPNGIVPMPDNVDEVFKIFDRYTKVMAPNGKPIHIVAEKGYTDDQVIYARKILKNHLTDIPGSVYGSDKSAIANAMADNQAILALFYSVDTMTTVKARRFFRSGVNAQDLRAYETILEGTPEYMDKENPVRDASYEEILHLIQDYGINDAAPVLIEKLWDAYRNALAKGLYTINSRETNEYFICGLEAYFDIWKHDPSEDGTREGEYVPITRAELREKDPAMYEIIEEFFGKTWLYTADISSDFEGTFSLSYDEDLTYTNKSRYLQNARLTGNKNSNLIGNDFENNLIGNSGDNIIIPGKAFDVVDGGDGIDTVVFPGNSSDYAIGRQYGCVVVLSEPESENQLTNVERIKFDNKVMDVSDIKDVPTLPDIDISGSKNGVVPLPDDVDLAFKIFSKYTKIVAPNGKPIHIVAHSGVSDRQIVYARDVLINHLADVPGSLYGADKTEIANMMANRNAVLSLSSRQRIRNDAALKAYRESGIVSQGLGDREIIIEGTDEYMRDDPRRDASYEEIMHFVHDQGILPLRAPMQRALYRALDKALETNTYNPDPDLPMCSFTQEYLIMGIEAYFGLWQHDPGGDGWSSGREYKYITREDFQKGDPDLCAIVEGFLHPYWAYTAKIASEFDGTFSMTYDKTLTYTNKSQYLKDATLTGSNHSNLIGNGRDNHLSGNSGENTVTGNRGDDTLDGNEGVDTAVFTGNSTDYKITRQGNKLIATDTVADRDGKDTLANIEKIKFADKVIDVSTI
jgi:hypothetical protein